MLTRWGFGEAMTASFFVLSATQVLLVSSLLAMELLRGSDRPTIMVALYAAVTGLVLGQATWALNYWRLDSLTGGLVLLVLFYDVVGLSQHALHGHDDVREQHRVVDRRKAHRAHMFSQTRAFPAGGTPRRVDRISSAEVARPPRSAGRFGPKSAKRLRRDQM